MHIKIIITTILLFCQLVTIQNCLASESPQDSTQFIEFYDTYISVVKDDVRMNWNKWIELIDLNTTITANDELNSSLVREIINKQEIDIQIAEYMRDTILLLSTVENKKIATNIHAHIISMYKQKKETINNNIDVLKKSLEFNKEYYGYRYGEMAKEYIDMEKKLLKQIVKQIESLSKS